jgi:hypothetical protein
MTMVWRDERLPQCPGNRQVQRLGTRWRVYGRVAHGLMPFGRRCDLRGRTHLETADRICKLIRVMGRFDSCRHGCCG